MNREESFQTLSELDDSLIAETIHYSPARAVKSSERIVQVKKRKFLSIALAAALILALGAAASALSGIPRSTGTHRMPKAAEYNTLDKLPKIEKDVGYPVTVPEQFSNGYAFSKISVDGEAVFGDGSEVLKEYYGVHVTYSKSDSSELTLHLSPVLELEGGSEAPTPSEQRTVDGVTVNLNRDHYKVVPENYEKTEDDLAREAAGHYYISWGSDEIMEYDMAFVDFVMDSVNYTLMDMFASESSSDTLMQMAEEILEAAKN